jgi:hypothetical protein
MEIQKEAIQCRVLQSVSNRNAPYVQPRSAFDNLTTLSSTSLYMKGPERHRLAGDQSAPIPAACFESPSCSSWASEKWGSSEYGWLSTFAVFASVVWECNMQWRAVCVSLCACALCPEARKPLSIHLLYAHALEGCFMCLSRCKGRWLHSVPAASKRNRMNAFCRRA